MVARFRVALLSALVSLVLAAPALLAYNGEVDKQVDVKGPGQVVCPAQATLTATVVDLNGNPLEGVKVTWSTGAVGTTDSHGKTSITINLTASGVVTATAEGGAVGSLAITCLQGDVGGAIGLPRTDTAVPGDSAPTTAWWAFLLAVIAGSGALVLATRRR